MRSKRPDNTLGSTLTLETKFGVQLTPKNIWAYMVWTLISHMAKSSQPE